MSAATDWGNDSIPLINLVPVSSLNLPVPASVPEVLALAASAVVLVLGSILGRRWYMRRRDAGPPGATPHLLMPAPNPDRPGRIGRLLGLGDPTANPVGRVATVLVLGVAILAVVLLFRGLESADATFPAYVQVAPRDRSSSMSEPGPGRIAGSEVAVDSATGDRLVLWSGDRQVGEPGRRLPQLLSVVVTDAEERPIVGREVRFTVESGGGSLEFESVVTGESGLAATRWRLGTDPEALEVVAALEGRPEVSVRFSAGFAARAPGSSAPGVTGPRPTEPESPTEDAFPAAAIDSAPAAPRRVAPVATPTPTSTWALGGVHTCRITGPGTVLCSGGPGSDAAAAAADSIRAVAAGISHVCGITADDAITCWGITTDRGADALAGEWTLPDGERPEEVAVGAEHVCVRSAAGRVFCRGANDRGQLGTGRGADASEFTPVSGIRDAVQLASGWFHACALSSSGQLRCWGANEAGQLGIGSTEDRSRPAPVDQPAPFVSLAAGGRHTCGLTAGGVGWCWGDNEYGALGTGSATGSRRPERIDTDLSFALLAAGGGHTCGLTRSGRAWCWGRNVFGQLGNGTTDDSSVPLPVRDDQVFRWLATGGAHTCGATAQGQLSCWGNNFQGQLGDGTRENRVVPVRSGGVR
ncbi:MAG: RCC1 domain-containing protein [Candidatus Longimicrobiales bacterium M2_2A_002]